MTTLAEITEKHDAADAAVFNTLRALVSQMNELNTLTRLKAQLEVSEERQKANSEITLIRRRLEDSERETSQLIRDWQWVKANTNVHTCQACQRPRLRNYVCTFCGDDE